ncbi:ergothioneine biosynthesis protein EgtB [Azospira restricta]|uniref:Ergothioneine biosynthesis protein EgtB n=1 Tax=Azospira restricta TaxID=404405 RepID=A0A974PY81_9RHOO|nr:ergothioneine biosynthesis protein EgtB [Azospira restricta]QRJ63185.1 ergothioneine biosynthesis protein EgtB [Azospira restricta]
MNERSPRDDARAAAAERYRAVRALSERLAEPLSAEDQGLQSMPDASPTRWHLAHTSWFFEALLLAPLQPGYAVFDPRFHYFFNSYYESLGPRQARPQRGLISRPGSDEIRRYRAHVDAAVQRLVAGGDAATWAAAAPLLELGLNHEQQHQELILTDIKHALAQNAFDPAYRAAPAASASPAAAAPAVAWCDFAGGEVAVGDAGAGFAYDNERPRHAVLLRPYRLASRPVTCGEYLDFIDDGGYARAALWLSDGWTLAGEQRGQAPLYWRREADGSWSEFTLHGRRPLDPAAPVCHVSFYEAAAYAAWAGARLPTEFEWEAAVADLPVAGRWLDADVLRPLPATPGPGLRQAFGDVWEWTRSAYDPYPGFQPLTGAAAEYNGKFMVGQLVLRGGSCASPAGHLRASYRNFFPPAARWQFSGIRLARDA